MSIQTNRFTLATAFWAVLASYPFASSALADNMQHNATLQTSQAQSNADAAIQAQLKGLMQQWTAAAVGFAQQAGSAVPWNQPNSTTPINYAPLYLYAGPGGASACQFAGGAGSPLPSVSGINLAAPVNLSGQRLTLSASDSNQAASYQQAIGNGNTFFPSQAGGPFNGTFCASAAYNPNGNAQQVQIVTWYAPSSAALAQHTSTQKTPSMVIYSAAQSFTNAINQSSLGGAAKPIYGENISASPSSWINQSTSKAAQFMGGMSKLLGN